MKIEEEIKQKKFESNYQMAHINIMFTANWLMDKSKTIFKLFGITPQQYNVLRILKGKHPGCCAAGDIKEVMLDKSPDLTRLIDRLMEKGFVTRGVCVENRRKLDIAITDKGLTLIKETAPKIKAQFEQMNSITNKESIELSRILDKMRE
ncbi:MAG: MarR family transcriptional regulator [Bacteroidetes bacterium]|nr:MarR family transcriptional regulator [Bacteroidota bacterium]